MRAKFIRSLVRPDIFDCEPGVSFPFRYCRVSIPRTQWLRNNGAIWVLESWQDHQKTAFTGLRATRESGFYKGNLLFPDGKRNILVEIDQPAGQIAITIQPKRTRKPRSRL